MLSVEHFINRREIHFQILQTPYFLCVCKARYARSNFPLTTICKYIVCHNTSQSYVIFIKCKKNYNSISLCFFKLSKKMYFCTESNHIQIKRKNYDQRTRR